MAGRERLVDKDEPDEAVRRLKSHRREANILEEDQARLDKCFLVALLQAEPRADNMDEGAACISERPRHGAVGRFYSREHQAEQGPEGHHPHSSPTTAGSLR